MFSLRTVQKSWSWVTKRALALLILSYCSRCYWRFFFLGSRNFIRKFCNLNCYYLIRVYSTFQKKEILTYIFWGKWKKISAEISKKFSEYGHTWGGKCQDNINFFPLCITDNALLQGPVFPLWISPLCWNGKKPQMMLADSQALRDLDYSESLQIQFSTHFKQTSCLSSLLDHFSCLWFSCFYLRKNKHT